MNSPMPAAYVLGELASEQQAALIARLRTLTDGVLLLVEPGTPRTKSSGIR